MLLHFSFAGEKNKNVFRGNSLRHKKPPSSVSQCNKAEVAVSTCRWRGSVVALQHTLTQFLTTGYERRPKALTQMVFISY